MLEKRKSTDRHPDSATQRPTISKSGLFGRCKGPPAYTDLRSFTALAPTLVVLLAPSAREHAFLFRVAEAFAVARAHREACLVTGAALGFPGLLWQAQVVEREGLLRLPLRLVEEAPDRFGVGQLADSPGALPERDQIRNGRTHFIVGRQRRRARDEFRDGPFCIRHCHARNGGTEADEPEVDDLPTASVYRPVHCSQEIRHVSRSPCQCPHGTPSGPPHDPAYPPFSETPASPRQTHCPPAPG
jgi:hypothetical protein